MSKRLSMLSFIFVLCFYAGQALAGGLQINAIYSKHKQESTNQGTTIIMKEVAASIVGSPNNYDGIYILLTKSDSLPFTRRTFVLKATTSTGAVIEYDLKRSLSEKVLYALIPTSLIDSHTTLALWAEGFDWPFDPANRSISADYQEYRTATCGNWHYHSGEDWNKTGNADNGDPVYAADFGQIVDMYEMGSGSGWFITIHHTHNDEDIYTSYLHVTGTDESANGGYTANTSGNQSTHFFINGDTSKPIQLGTSVKRGDMIARIQSGMSHLHFEVKKRAGLTGGRHYNWHTMLNSSWYRSPNWQCSYTDSAMLTEDGFLKPSDFINANRPIIFTFPDALTLPN